MFLIRQAKPADVSTLLKLARMVYFINLPPEERVIAAKIDHSTRCFRRVAGAPEEKGARPRRSGGGGKAGFANIEEDSDNFMFAIEDVESGGVIGTSQVRTRQGGPGNPNWSMRVSEKRFYSQSLGMGTTHTVGQLYADESGPTEIGGLILQPSHRGHPLRPGRFLSFVRFHFVALHRGLFADRILAEMMGPVTNEGDSVFWDAFGRKFIPVKFAEADRFCQHNRKFISELLPKEEIYLTLLPLDVINMLGSVSRETIPARRILENLGFKYTGSIDPFDGGPHLYARTDEVSLVKATSRGELGRAIAEEKCPRAGIVSVLDRNGEFRAVETRFAAVGGEVRVPSRAMELLNASTGAAVGSTALADAERDGGGGGRRVNGAKGVRKASENGRAGTKRAPSRKREGV